jgi:hypothetical protein
MAYGTKDFINKVKSGGGFGKMDDWKEKGKTIGWIHKDGFRERHTHNMMVHKVKDKNGEVKYFQKMFICPGNSCPLCALVEWAKQEAEGMDEDKDFSVINRTVNNKDKKGSDRTIAYTMRELAGMGDWKHKMGASPEFLFGWVRRDNRSAEDPVKIMQATPGLATAIKRVIQGQIEDRGERRGDPLVSPYAIKFTYSKDAVPAQKFGAERVDSDIAPLEDEVLEILNTPMTEFDIDLDKMVKPNSGAEIMASIAYCWDEDCPKEFGQFEQFYDSVAGGEAEERGGRTEREKRVDKAQDRREKMHGRGRHVDEVPGDDSDVVGGVDEESDNKDDVEEDVPPSRAPRRTRSTPVEEAKGRVKLNSRIREGFSIDEVAPELEDDEEEVKPKTSSRRRAEPEPESKTILKKSSGKGNFVVCPECGEKVIPSKYNKCPSCAAELDVDVPF